MARPKNGSQRGTAVTSVTQITYKYDLTLCRLQLINQQFERLAKNANENSCARMGSSVVFAAVVIWRTLELCLGLVAFVACRSVSIHWISPKVLQPGCRWSESARVSDTGQAKYVVDDFHSAGWDAGTCGACGCCNHVLHQ